MFGLNFRQLFGLLVLAALIFAGVQYVPPCLDAYQFKDFIRQEVKYAVTARRTLEQVRAAIVQEAKGRNIPIGPRDIHITRRGPAFTIDLEYRVPIDLRIYQHELVFHSNESGEVFE